MSQVFSTQIFGPGNRLMPNATLDLSDPLAHLILPGWVSAKTGLIAPTMFNVSPAPVPGGPTITLSWKNVPAGTFLAGPVSGAQGPPVFRHIQLSDIPGIGGPFQPLNSILTQISSGTWAGSASITTLGTITAGVWNGTPIALGNMATIADQRILGNVSGAPAAPSELTNTNVLAMIGYATTDHPTLKGLTLYDNSGILSQPFIITGDGGQIQPTLQVFSDTASTTAPLLMFYRGRGSAAAPAPVLSGDRLGGFSFGGVYDITGASGYAANVRSFVGSDWNAGSREAYLSFGTTGAGSASAIERAKLSGAGWWQWSKYGAGIVQTDSSGNVTSAAVALSSLATQADQTLLGNVSGGVAVPSAITAAQTKTFLGVTTIGGNLMTLTNPGAITFPRFNVANTVDALSDSAFRTAIGTDAAGTARPASDVYAWAKALTKPSYTYTEVGADPAGAAAAITLSGLGGVPSTRKITASIDLSADRNLTYSDVGADAAGAAAARQAAFTILTTLGNLSTVTTGWLHNSAGVLAYSTPTYTDVGADAAGAAAAVTPITLGLVIGTNVQAYNAKLTGLSALADAAGWYHSTGAGVYAWSTPTYSDVGADVAGAAAARQAAYANLTTVGALANGSGWLHNDGAGAFAYSTPTAANVGALATVTADAPLSGSGTAGSHLVIGACGSAAAGTAPASGTPAARNFLTADITTGNVSWGTILDGNIPSALTGKTINGMTPGKQSLIYAMGDSLTYSCTWSTQLVGVDLSSSVWKVINRGVGGATAAACAARFAFDVTACYDASVVNILAGINDVVGDYTAVAIEASLQSLYTAAHGIAGCKVIACTIPPFGNNASYTVGRDAVRVAVNAWIMSGTPTGVDYKANLDAALWDPADHTKLAAANDSGDGLHLSTVGYNLMCDTIFAAAAWTPNSSAGTVNAVAGKSVTIDQDLCIGTYGVRFGSMVLGQGFSSRVPLVITPNPAGTLATVPVPGGIELGTSGFYGTDASGTRSLFAASTALPQFDGIGIRTPAVYACIKQDAALTAPTGLSSVNLHNFSITGDAGGNSSIAFLQLTCDTFGATNYNSLYGEISTVSHSNAGTVGTIYGRQVNLKATGVGNVTTVYGTSIYPQLTGAGNFTNVYYHDVVKPNVTSSGDITGTIRGINIQDIGRAAAASVHGINIADLTAGTATYGIYSSMNTAAGKYFINAAGTATSRFYGSVAFNAGLTATTGGFSGQVTSTLATGTAPLVVASTTLVANLNAATAASAAACSGNAATATKWASAVNLAGNSVDGSAAAPFANAFIVQGTADAGLTGAQFLGALGTGAVKNTTTTGVLSICSAQSDYPGLTSTAKPTFGALYTSDVESAGTNTVNKSFVELYGSSSGMLQIASATSTGTIVFGTTNASANFAYSARGASSGVWRFTVTSFSPKIAIPGTTFTVDATANTYTVIRSDGNLIYVTTDNTGEAATGQLDAVSHSLAALTLSTAQAATVAGAFGCNGKAAQTAYASGGALAAYGAGTNGFDTAPHASALYAMVVAIRAALVANGTMS